MEIRRLSQREWEFEVRRALKVREQNQQRFKRVKYHYYEDVIGQIMPLPYILGGAAVVALLLIYGVEEFFKFFLSWTVSITIVATIMYHLWKHFERQV